MRAALVAGTALRVVDPILAVVFPARCPACAAPVGSPLRGPLCPACWRALPRHGGPLCACGLPLPGATTACGRCRRGLTPFTAGASLGPYEGALRVLIHELKYRGRQRVAARLADLIVADPRARAVLAPRALVVPVPLHPRRRRERGFNQSELLARALARRLPVTVCADALARRRDTPPQTGLTAGARRRNVSGAFALRRAARVAGRVVVLVDDVLTTGATAHACARLLRQAGAAEVRLLTLARVA